MVSKHHFSILIQYLREGIRQQQQHNGLAGPTSTKNQSTLRDRVVNDAAERIHRYKRQQQGQLQHSKVRQPEADEGKKTKAAAAAAAASNQNQIESIVQNRVQSSPSNNNGKKRNTIVDHGEDDYNGNTNNGDDDSNNQNVGQKELSDPHEQRNEYKRARKVYEAFCL
jgi:hypothetical protein